MKKYFFTIKAHEAHKNSKYEDSIGKEIFTWQAMVTPKELKEFLKYATNELLSVEKEVL